MKLLLVDGDNVAHRCFTDRGLCARHRDEQVLPIAFLRYVLSVVRDYRINRVLCAWDFGHSPIRTALHPNYKGSRVEKHKSPTSKHNVIAARTSWMRDLLSKLGIVDISPEQGEADDMIYQAWAFARALDWDVTLMSNDSDLRQMLDSGTEIHLGKRKAPMTEETFREKWGFRPWMNAIYKAMVGDSSDDIPGVRGIGTTTAKSLMLMIEREQPSTMMEALAALRAVASSNRRAGKLLTEDGWASLKMALRLIDLSMEPCPDRTQIDPLEDRIMFPTQDANDLASAHQMLVNDGLAEVAFDLPVYWRELVRLPHGS